MRFGAPWAFALLVLAPLVLFLWAWLERWRDRRVARAGDKPLIDRLSEASSHRRRRGIQAGLFAASLFFMALALARPQLGMRSEVRKARGMDVVVALDLSRSMLARDVVPSRLERARIELGDLIDRLPGDRVGLVGFTSIALPLCPLTVDHAALALQLRAATPDDLPRGGTSIGDAIRAARQMLESAPETGAARAIVVVTDGEEHEGEPEKLAEEAKKAGIEVHVVGVGSRTGEPIPLMDETGKVTGYLKDGEGRTVVSRLNEEMLTSVANAGGGLVAMPGENGGLDLSPVRSHLATLKKAELEDRVVRIYEERYQWPLLLALMCLLLATVVRPTRKMARVVVKGLVVLLCWTGTAEAAPFEKEDPDARAGSKALEEGNGEEAAKAYQRAIDRLGEDPRLLYDRALAEAAAGELDKSIDSLKSALESSNDPKMRGQAAFALGNAYRQLKKYDDALKSYRRSLIEDPTNPSVRKNLEIARQQKIIQALQPKDPNQDQEQGEDGEKNDDENQENPDGGTSDAGAPDAAPQDSGNDDDKSDGGSDSKDGGSNNGAQDGGVQDAGGSPPPEPDEEASEEERSQQDVEEILDSLAEQEKALERKRKLERFRGRKVTKDW